MSLRNAWTVGSLLVVIATVAGLIASAELVVDYLRPDAVFCNESGSGCLKLRMSSYAAWGNVPTPVIGLAGFLVQGIIAFFRSARMRTVHLAMSAAAAVFAVTLIAVQVHLGTFCRLCLVADSSAIVLAIGSFLRARVAIDALPPRPVWLAPAFGGAMAMALVGPLAFGFTRPAANPLDGPVVVPQIVEDEMRATARGQVTVVDFVDFECPFCRSAHAGFGPVLDKYKDKVRVIRKQVPLTRIHPHAMDAARAACCGEKLGKEHAMAEALFSAPVDDLTPAGCEKLAASVGLDTSAFRACVGDPQIQQRIDSEVNTFRTGGGLGLPTIWIERERFVGARAQDPSALEAAIVSAIKQKG